MQQWLNCGFLCVRSIRYEKTVKDAVCLIECIDQGQVKVRGTGFHYDSGWVMTVAHNVQEDDKDDGTCHTYISEGKFRVLFYVDGKEYEFPQRKRMAFFHHLNTEEDVDIKKKYIWMVKLGIQYEYGRNPEDYSDWENDEKKMLDAMLPSNFGLAELPQMFPSNSVLAMLAQMFPSKFGLAQVAAADPKKGDGVYVVYYDDDNKSKLVKEVKIEAITQGKQAKTTNSKRSKPSDKRTFLLIDYLALLKLLPENGL